MIPTLCMSLEKKAKHILENKGKHEDKEGFLGLKPDPQGQHAVVGIFGIWMMKKKDKTAQAVKKTTPHVNEGEGASLVPGAVRLLYKYNKKIINEDQEGCKLGLKPAPDENW